MIFLLIFNLAFAVSLTPSGLTEKIFSFKEACQSLNYDSNPLIEPINSYTLDCMGKKMDLFSFCEKKMAPEKFTRGVVSADGKNVICAEAETVTLNIPCQKSRKGLCQKPKVSCLHFKERVAKGHQLIHQSVTENSGKQLNCYYSASKKN